MLLYFSSLPFTTHICGTTSVTAPDLHDKSQEKLPVNTGPDGHFHRQRRSVIAPYACRLSPFDSVVGTI